jgi:hypothetical protein
MLFYIIGGAPQAVPGTACVEANQTACTEVCCSSAHLSFIKYLCESDIHYVSSLEQHICLYDESHETIYICMFFLVLGSCYLRAYSFWPGTARNGNKTTWICLVWNSSPPMVKMCSVNPLEDSSPVDSRLLPCPWPGKQPPSEGCGKNPQSTTPSGHR